MNNRREFIRGLALTMAGAVVASKVNLCEVKPDLTPEKKESVAAMVAALEAQLAKTMNGRFIFDEPTEDDYKAVRDTLRPYLEDGLTNRQYWNYSITCDQTNNTVEDRRNRIINAEVWIQPTPAIHTFRKIEGTL